MVRVGLFAAADETRLLGNIAKVPPVTIAPQCGNDEHALVDAVGLIEVTVSFRARLMGAHKIDMSSKIIVFCGFRGYGRCEFR